MGELLAKDVVEEEFELLDPRSSRELAFDMPVDGENAIGEEKPERGSAALLATSDGVRRAPLWSPEFPSGVIRGRVAGIGTRGCTEGMGGLTGMGVRMGMADIADMDNTPIDRFGIEPIPNLAEEGMVDPQLVTGDCFMMTGKVEGTLCP